MFSAKVRKHLKSYVYAYSDPRTGQPFYIGQGSGNRAFQHLTDQADSEKVRTIRELTANGLRPIISILRHGLSPEEAELAESVCIDLLDIGSLTNKVKGKYSRAFGRASVEDVIRRYDARPIRITHKCLAINIRNTYRPGMTPRELYEATRGIWPLGPDCSKAHYALAVVDDVVLEVYRIEGWLKAGAVFSERDHSAGGRVEFVGNVAKDAAATYKGRSVPSLFAGGARFPVRYLNIKTDAA